MNRRKLVRRTIAAIRMHQRYPREHFPLPDNMTHWYPLPTPQMLGGLAIRHDIEEGEEQEFVTAGRIAPDLCVRARGYPIGIGGMGGFDAKS